MFVSFFVLNLFNYRTTDFANTSISIPSTLSRESDFLESVLIIHQWEGY
jgi:hypothetical protein